MERTNRTPWCSLGELKSPPPGPTSEEEAEASFDDPSTDLSQSDLEEVVMSFDSPPTEDYPTTGPNQRYLVNYRRVVLQALQMDQIRWEMENLQTWFARMRRRELIGRGIERNRGIRGSITRRLLPTRSDEQHANISWATGTRPWAPGRTSRNHSTCECASFAERHGAESQLGAGRCCRWPRSSGH